MPLCRCQRISVGLRRSPSPEEEFTVRGPNQQGVGRFAFSGDVQRMTGRVGIFQILEINSTHTEWS
jgi:hypothetical protein